jgi:hypothetical protein
MPQNKVLRMSVSTLRACRVDGRDVLALQHRVPPYEGFLHIPPQRVRRFGGMACTFK